MKKRDTIRKEKIEKRQEKKNKKQLARYTRREKLSKWWLTFKTKFSKKVK